MENFIKYMILKNKANQAVSEAKCKIYDFFCKLDTKEGKKDIYRLARSIETKLETQAR